MPSDRGVLGFGSRWYREARRSAIRCKLPSGITINLMSAAAFIATKLEACDTRGGGDMAASHDFEDVLAVIEGRSTVVTDIAAAVPELKLHLALRFSALMANAALQNALRGLITQDALREQRVAEARSRLGAIARL